MTSLDALNPSTAQDSNGPGEWAEANPVNDPSLNALLANLHEGTLLSLMEDHDLFSDLNAYPLSPCEGGSGTGDQSSNDLDLKELLGDQWQLVDLELDDQSLELPSPLGSNDCDVTKLAKGKSERLLVPNFQEDYASGKQNSCADVTLREAFLTQTTSETAHSQSESNLSPCEVAEAKPTPVTQQQQTPSFTIMREDSLASCRKRLKVSRHQRDLSSSGSDSDISSSNDSDAMECEELGEPQAGVTRVASRGMGTSHEHILACVQHDHPYATTQHPSGGQRSPVFTDGGDAGMEEGSNSDAGYETMSASTSPGNHSSSTITPSKQIPSPKPSPSSPPSSFPLPLPPLPPLGGNVDPVALIDARIKHFMCSRQVNLTEEEKETLKAEGLPIPTTLPLTKVEEKALKTVRRKIRNKLAAKESRRRKKENLSVLEDRVKQFSSENVRLKKRVETLETENKSLLSQLRKLQGMLASSAAVANTNRTTQVGACLMVVVLCFAIFFGNWMPHKFWSTPTNDYTTAAVRSRSLLSVENPQNFQQAACDWFRHIFFRDEGDIRQQSDSKETDHNSNYRSYRTDFYSALTPPLNALQMDNETQRNNYVSVKA